MPERLTDDQILARAGAGDQAAFQELYGRYRIPIFRFAYRLLGSVELAEDVTHDCFLSVIRSSGNFNPELGSLKTYLFGTARNLVLKYFRSANRETALDDMDYEPPTPARQQPLEHLLEEELGQKVMEAVTALPPFQREALVLFEYEGLALSEIANIVGADVGAVKARLFRARQRLKNELISYLNSQREMVTLEKALK